MRVEFKSNAIVQVAKITSAYVRNNLVPAGEVAGLIAATYSALVNQTKRDVSRPELVPVGLRELRPAIPISESITPDYQICLDDGLKFKALKGHLRKLGMTPDEYRIKWGLPKTYPMVAAKHSALRSALAKSWNLGNS